MENMENAQSLENTPDLPIQKLESGNLAPEEKARVEKLYTESARYGTPLHFHNFDGRTGKSLSINDNYVDLQAQVARRVAELQITSQEVTYNNLSAEQQMKIDNTAFIAPEQRPSDTPDLKKLTPPVATMRVDQLEDVMLEDDYRNAEYAARQNFDTRTGEAIPNPVSQPDASVDKVAELSRRNTVERHAIQNAAQYQLEASRYVNFEGGMTGEDYLNRVNEVLSQKSN